MLVRASAVLFLISLAGAQPLDPSAIDVIANEGLRLSGAPGLAVAVVRGEQVIHLKGHGVREAGRPEPVTPQTIFAIGSLTKAFTAAAMAMLVDEGKMAWDDPVRKHLPYFHLHDPLADAQVTLRDLLTHRTGVGATDLLWMAAPWSLEEAIRRLAFIPPSRPFRTAYQYQNMMYNAAGYAVGEAAGTSWHQFLKRRIFEPLEMKTVVFASGDAQAAPDHATPHRKGKPVGWYADDRQIRPAGSIKACARDLAQWVRFQLGDGSFAGRRLISERNLREMHSPQVVVPGEDSQEIVTYGLGWNVRSQQGQRLLSHGGAVVGFRAYVALAPKERLGVLALANDESWVAETTALSVLHHLLGVPKRARHAEAAARERLLEERRKKRQGEHEEKRSRGTRPSREPAAYAGDYLHPAYGTARVHVESGELVLHWSSFRTPLRHFDLDTFDLTGEDRLEGQQAVFTLEGSRGVAALNLLGVQFGRAQERSRLDFQRMAARIIEALRLGSSDRVLLRFDPDHFAELVGPLVRRIGAARATPLSAREPLPSLDNVDVFLWLPLGRTAREFTAQERKALAGWLDRGGARRQIHFHWADGSRRPDGLPGEHTPELDAMYQDALGIDYQALDAAQERAIALMRQGTVRISTPAGTDVFFRAGTRPFNKQNGDASPGRMQRARIRIDREIELPAGVLRVAPVEQTAAGVIVIPEARFGDTVAKKVALYIDNGRVSRIRAEQGQEAVEAALKAGGESAMWLREFGIGFNPKLTGTAYYGYGAGVVRLSLGDNEELGGKVRGGFVRWFFFPDATVHVDYTYIVKAGKLVL